MEENRGIIDRFIQIRTKKGFSQEKMGKELGISGSAVSQIEMGQTIINEKHIKLISGVFGINEEWLRTGEGPIEKEGFNSLEEEIINVYRQLSPDGQKIVMDYIDYVQENERKMRGAGVVEDGK